MEESQVCGVLISYFPSREVLTNVAVLLEQVAHVVIVDNTAGSDACGVLSSLEDDGRCTVIRNGANLGIAAALNTGIRRAIALGYPWVVTFDQDSRIGEGYIAGIFSAYRKAKAETRVGMLFPRYQDAECGVFLSTHRSSSGDVFACLTSGAMIHADTFASIGPMEERFFIDYVDLEYCMRIRAAGLKIIECPDAILAHSLGKMTLHRMFARSFSTTNHSPMRRYYITRNRLTLIRQYYSKEREWAIADVQGLMKDIIKILLVEKDKLAKAKYMARGLFDAIFGRLGRRVEL